MPSTLTTTLVRWCWSWSENFRVLMRRWRRLCWRLDLLPWCLMLLSLSIFGIFNQENSKHEVFHQTVYCTHSDGLVSLLRWWNSVVPQMVLNLSTLRTRSCQSFSSTSGNTEWHWTGGITDRSVHSEALLKIWAGSQKHQHPNLVSLHGSRLTRKKALVLDQVSL